MKRSIFIILFLFFGGFIFSLPTKSFSAEHLLITEVQIVGQSSSNDFIEIYNPGDNSLNISSYKLRKKTEAGREYSVRVFPEGSVIQAKGHFLWANSKEGYNEILGADVTSTQTLAKNNSIALLDSEGNIIDSLAWGSGLENPFGEGAIFPENLGASQSLERKFLSGNYQDTNDNANDFILNNNPNPKGSGSQLPPEPVCTTEICDGIDNDCDGFIDEDLGVITCGVGACEVTLESCTNGIAQTCTPGVPTDEICDQIDNDCDGQIDEGGVCEVPEPPTSQTEPVTYPSNIFINEFLPSPEGADSEEEFIEFFNSNATSVDLSGWEVEDTQGSTKSYTFPDGTDIQGYGFLVLGRPTSKIVLNNDGEGLILNNPLGSVVDSAFYEGKAPEGQSYARKTDGVWEWTLVLTAGEENRFSAPVETKSESESEPEILTGPEAGLEIQEESQSSAAPSPAETSEDKPQPKPIVYPFGILINEILPSPTGPDAEEEWIEIFNKNNFKVNLSGWQIQDIRGKTKTYIFPEGTKISPQSFLVLSRQTSKITLNNNGDGLNLVLPNGEIRDQVSYEKAPTGKSYNRTDSGWDWSDTLTPGSENIIPAQIIKEEEEKEEAGGTAEIPEKGLAGISQSFPKSSRGLFVLLTAFVIAIFSGIIVFILKKKLKLE